MSNDPYDMYDELMDDLDEIEGDVGVDEHAEEEAQRMPYIGVHQLLTPVPEHVKAGQGFSVVHRDDDGNPVYNYTDSMRFMVVKSLTFMAGRERVGGRKLQIPKDDVAGEQSSIFPKVGQQGNGYGQACQTFNGIFPHYRFEGDMLRDIRSGNVHKVGWRGDEQLPPQTICQSCPFSQWADQSLTRSTKPLCQPSWTWVIYLFPGQPGTDADGNKIEIPAGLYRLTGYSLSVQTALFGVPALKRDGKSRRWGALASGEGITGLNDFTKPRGTVTVTIPLTVTLTKRQQKQCTGDIINAKGVIVDQDTAEKAPDKHFYQVVSQTTKQFPEGKPELVGDTQVLPLLLKTAKNNNQLIGGTPPVSVPVTQVGEEPITPDEYMGYLRAWVEFNRLYAEQMTALNTSDFLLAQEKSAEWHLGSGESDSPQLLEGAVDAEVVEAMDFDE